MKKLFTLLLLIPFVANATTLFQWYGGKLPSISERSKEYALYFPDFYQGTKDQNIRFLDAKQGIHGTLARPKVDIRALAVDPSEYSLLNSHLLGAQNAVGGRVYSLSGSGVSLSGTSIGLTSFKVAGADIKLGMSDFGALGCGTIEPGNVTKQEFVSFTGVTQNSDGTATLSGVTRGLSPVSPYTASTTQQKAHGGSSQFVISNSPPCFYESVASTKNAQTIDGLTTFTTSPISRSTATSSAQFVTLGELTAVSITGAATSTENISGVSALSSNSDLQSGTASTTTGMPRVIPSRVATSSPKATAGWVPLTDSTGKIPASFIATSSLFNFTGGVGVGTSTPARDFSVQGSTYTSGNAYIGGTITSTSSLPSTLPYASTTALTVAGTASTTNIQISGSCLGSCPWSYTGSSTPYLVTSGTLTSTGSIPSDANFGIVKYSISSAFDMEGNDIIARAGATTLELRTEDAGAAAQYLFTWSGANLTINEDVDGTSQISGTVFWYR